MLSVAIIIFREVLEIVLILSLVLAATRGLPRRNTWVAVGFAGGIFGAALVAIFTDVIANLAEGMGQELFNAGILLVASILIGWTVLWMRQHAREVTAQFKKVGKEIAAGKTPFYTLSIIIALSILREGSEIVMFSYGALASGTAMSSFLAGALLGVVNGLAIGVLLYYGLVKISLRHFFTVTTWLLVLLVAGMMSQAMVQLVQAGYFYELSRPLWDTSWLLSEKNVLGQSLKVLLGYSARPMLIQLIVYVATLTGLMAAIKWIDRGPSEPEKLRQAVG